MALFSINVLGHYKKSISIYIRGGYVLTLFIYNIWAHVYACEHKHTHVLNIKYISLAFFSLLFFHFIHITIFLFTMKAICECSKVRLNYNLKYEYII